MSLEYFYAKDGTITGRSVNGRMQTYQYDKRGQVLAVVEVKQRTTLEAALEAVTETQRDRLRRAGRAIAARRPSLQNMAVRLDLIALAPGRLPVHSPDAWKGA